VLQDWTKRWTQPTKWKKAAEMGKLEHTAGLWYGDEKDKGIKTSEDSRFYGLSAKLETPFVSKDKKDLVLQYVVRHEQDPKLDCGGAYLKLLPGGKKFDAASFGGDTPYAVMFGPDVCGTTKRTHVIFNYEKKNENLLIKKDIHCETDQLSHLYTLVLHPDNTFEVFVDKKSVRKGKLADEFDFLEPKEIKDPEAKKPEDWVDNEMMDDPDDKKPDDWDSVPKEIKDPDAKKPEDWDDEDDGEWEAPMIPNPDYKGEWKPKRIKNPDYKGKWKHPMIPNPDFVDDPNLYDVCRGEGCTHIGFEIWQVMSGTLFDDIIVTDSLDEAFDFAEETFFKRKDAEKKMKDEKDAAKAPSDEDMDLGADLDDDDEDFDMGMGDEF
jgi:calreticulin